MEVKIVEREGVMSLLLLHYSRPRRGAGGGVGGW